MRNAQHGGRSNRCPVVVSLVVALGGLSVGCGSAAETGNAPNADDVPYAASLLHWPASADMANGARTVRELLPNSLGRALDGSLVADTDTVILGRAVSVTPEAALVWSGAGDGQPERVEFDSPDSDRRSWMILVEPTEVLGGEPPESLVDPVDGGLVAVRVMTAGGDQGEVDVDRFEGAVRGLGSSVWFLSNSDNGTPEGLAEAFRPAWFDVAVAMVGADGQLAFPFMSQGTAPWIFEDSPTTLDELRAAAKEPVQERSE